MPSELSYASAASDVPLLGDTIGANLDRAARLFAERDALVECWTGRRWTYREFVSDVDTLALGLLERGIGKGGIWAPNCAEWALVQYATAKLGAILVNINPDYRAHELEYVLNQAGVMLLIAAERFKSSDYAAIIEKVRPRCEALKQVVLLGGEDWNALLGTGRRTDRGRLSAIAHTLGADDPINIQYTSGTTGFPKGATLSHHNILKHPQQRLFRRRAVWLFRVGPDLHTSALLSLLWHGVGQPRRDEPRCLHGHPGAVVRSASHAGSRRRRALHVAIRRPDNVHRRVGRIGIRGLRPG